MPWFPVLTFDTTTCTSTCDMPMYPYVCMLAVQARVPDLCLIDDNRSHSTPNGERGTIPGPPVGDLSAHTWKCGCLPSYDREVALSKLCYPCLL